jgi:site-specific DNA recombinase
MKLRCGVYARYSSDRQSPCSITDQVRKCREHAKSKGWEVLTDHIYSDEAISGATLERSGLKRLLEAATEQCFDIVLIDDTSRLSRQLVDSINLTERLKFAGVRIVFISQGIDSDSEQAEVLTAVHGLVDGLYIKELASKTKRGLEGKALAKLHTGGRIFGYRSVPIEDANRRDQYNRPVIAGVRLAVDAAQAKIVRRIYSLYASGFSLKAITKQLNAEHVRSPQPREGRQQSWAPSSVRVILHNERYRGIVVWSKTKKVRNPQTGRRVRRPRPKSEWLRVEMPEQRIIPEQLWKAVAERIAYINRTYGIAGSKGGKMNLRAAASPYIFSGLLLCGECGSNYVIVAGGGRNKKGADYGCPRHHLRGTCSNARRVSRELLETELLSKIQNEVLSDATIDFLLAGLEREIEKRFASLNSEVDTMRRRKEELETKLKNLARFFEDGNDSPTIRAAITAHEAEIAAITDKTLGRKKGSVHQQIAGLRKFVRDGVSDIRELLAGKHAQPALVRQELAKHIDAITLLPDGKGNVRYKGEWKLLGSANIRSAEGQS